jgi:2-phosphoglycerate kinase
LFGELKWFLARYLAERDLVSQRKAERYLSGVGDYPSFKAHQRDGFRGLLGSDAPDAATLQRIDAVILHIEEGVAEMVRKYLHLWGHWYIDELNEMVALMEDNSVRELVHELSPHAWHGLVRWLFPRLARIPHIKNLNKPTVVLITGTSGTGKSSVAQHIARSLSIPIYFSTDVVAREVVRSTLDGALGPATARRELPELYGSSFALPAERQAALEGGVDRDQALIDWYYGHAMLTMIGVRGILDRLLATDNSAVIEGVPLIPGFLPEHYFARLNIVWVVTTIADKDTHFERYAGRDRAGVDRGGAERYRQRFDEIRLIHDLLERLGHQAGCTVVDNTHGLGETAELALDRIENFYAARGLPISDPDRERVSADIEARRGRIWSERLLGLGALEARDGSLDGQTGDQSSPISE